MPCSSCWAIETFLPGLRTFRTITRTFTAKCRGPRPSICGSTIALPVWRPLAMRDKPQLAVGLDLGSSSCRCLILLLEAGHLRYVGHSEVPSDGWSKGRFADQQAVTTCVRAAVRDAEAQAQVSVDSMVGGGGGSATQGAN